MHPAWLCAERPAAAANHSSDSDRPICAAPGRGAGWRSPFLISAVVQGELWQVQTPLPGGTLVIDRRIDDLGDGRLKLSKRYVASGPVVLAFPVYSICIS